MIGEGRGSSSSNQLNPNYDYEDSRNSIPMMDRDPTSTGSINIGMDGGGGDTGRRGHSSPRHYSRDLMDPDGKRRFSLSPLFHVLLHSIRLLSVYVPLICVLDIFSNP